MKFLQGLIQLQETSDDLSRLPNDVMTAIRANIRKGAEDLSQKWANALELVHKAYEAEGVQRPDPTMEAAWEQYEENLQYAVHQLAKNRGMDADWRMSSAMFHESVTPKQQFRVRLGSDTFLCESDSINTLTNKLVRTIPDLDARVVDVSDETRKISFFKWGVKHQTEIAIEKAEKLKYS